MDYHILVTVTDDRDITEVQEDLEASLDAEGWTVLDMNEMPSTPGVLGILRESIQYTQGLEPGTRDQLIEVGRQLGLTEEDTGPTSDEK